MTSADIILTPPSFLIYTSGSTGKPKGVLQTQLCIENLALWHTEFSGMAKGLNVLQMSAFAFDASIHEMIYARASGGTLVCVPESVRQDLSALPLLIQKHQINLLWLPISFLNSALEEDADFLAHCTSVRYIVATGEQLKIGKALAHYLENNPEVSLYNFYGPSETHVVTSHTINARLGNIEPIPPIGKPILNSTVYILDKYGFPVPVGVIGEIFIGGANLAIGYQNLPELTASKFTTLHRKSERIYQTGDLGRWREDGSIDFLGRIDEQVKIRGFRVEPIEIEAELLQYPQIRQAVVTPFETQNGQKALRAFLLMGDDFHFNSKALRDFLASRLPDYMIPAEFVPVAEIPLNANGKVDKRKLSAQMPTPEIITIELPNTPTEIALAAIWQSLLQKTDIDRNADFFASGGHSLLVMRLQARIRKFFGASIRLKDVFEKPTLSALAEWIDIQSKSNSETQPPITRSEKEIRPLSPAQATIWANEKLTADKTLYQMPVTLAYTGKLNQGSLANALQKLINRHEILRTAFIEIEGVPYQKSQSPLTPKGGKNKGEWSYPFPFGAGWGWAFDLANPPLFRLRIESATVHNHLIHFNCHHIIADAVSQQLFLKELWLLYHAVLNESSLELPELTVQYADCADWLNAHLPKTRSATLEIPHLPQDDLGGAANSVPLQVQLTLSDTDYQTLQAFCQQQNLTSAQCLMAVTALWQGYYTGTYRAYFGITTHGRVLPEMEHQLGVFVQIVPFEAALQAESTIQDLIRISKNNLSAPQAINNEMEMVLNILPYMPLPIGLRIKEILFASIKYNLEWQWQETETGAIMTLLGKANMYRQDTLEMMLKDWKKILASITSNKQQAIAEIMRAVSPAPIQQPNNPFEDLCFD